MISLHCRPPGETATEVIIGDGVTRALRQRAASRSVFVLRDARIGDEVRDALAPQWTVHDLAAGEQVKTLATAETVLRAMVRAGIGRDGVLVAIGGGTIGDLGGLCAALYLRGIECWQVPTTTMGMIDSAVGGKTAVNLPEGKNLVGAVHPPTLVAVEPRFAHTLPQREFDSGLAEAIKMAIGCDARLFALLEQHADAVLARDATTLAQVVQLAIAAKIAVVEGDLREDGARRLLNLGHTLGHALEAHGDFAVPHGLCVARGLHFALDLAASRGAIAAADADRCRALLTRYGHRATPLPARAALEPFLRRDKKAAGDDVHFVLPAGIGRAVVTRLPLAEVLRQLPT